MCVAVGKVSLDDCDMLTSSLGCTVTPFCAAMLAITSLVFMFELVPEPVWNTSIGNWSSCRPSAISPAAAMIASAFSGASNPRSLFTWAQAPFSRSERADLRALEPAARDREVLHRPLRLCAPQRVDGHPDLAHGVVLDAVFGSVVELHGRRSRVPFSCR